MGVKGRINAMQPLEKVSYKLFKIKKTRGFFVYCFVLFHYGKIRRITNNVLQCGKATGVKKNY